MIDNWKSCWFMCGQDILMTNRLPKWDLLTISKGWKICYSDVRFDHWAAWVGGSFLYHCWHHPALGGHLAGERKRPLSPLSVWFDEGCPHHCECHCCGLFFPTEWIKWQDDLDKSSFGKLYRFSATQVLVSELPEESRLISAKERDYIIAHRCPS